MILTYEIRKYILISLVNIDFEFFVLLLMYSFNLTQIHSLY